MEHYLILSTLLFLIGLFGIVLNRKNILIILMSIDKGLYFPLFLILTCPIIWYYNNYIICFFYFFLKKDVLRTEPEYSITKGHRWCHCDDQYRSAGGDGHPAAVVS